MIILEFNIAKLKCYRQLSNYCIKFWYNILSFIHIDSEQKPEQMYVCKDFHHAILILIMQFPLLALTGIILSGFFSIQSSSGPKLGIENYDTVLVW